MRYMVHTFPDRLWYVNDYLIPSMTVQGIDRSDIIVWNDSEYKGNMAACLESFASCEGISGGTWHLQDDIVISPDFAERTKKLDYGVVHGFVCEYAEGFCIHDYNGVQPAIFSWYSFPCIRIPNDLAVEFVNWYYETAVHDSSYFEWIRTGKYDDSFWKEFMQEEHGNMMVLNLKPCLVEHIDWMIGGSRVNPWRGRIARAAFWEHEDLIENLKNELARH